MNCALGVIATAVALFFTPIFPGLAPAMTLSEGGGERSGNGGPRLVQAYGQQALPFEPAGGSEGMTYLARGRGYTLFLGPAEISLVFAGRSQARHEPEGLSPTASPATIQEVREQSLRIRFLYGNPAAHLDGLDKLSSRSNYFIGNDPNQWRTNVPHHAKVRLESVYPGVDLVFYGNGKQLEHDFLVAPGADTDQIRLALEGAEQVTLKDNGDLALLLPGSELTLHAPIAYQDSEAGRERVHARFLLADNGQVGFEVGPYDTARPLIIDPVLSYSTYLGGGAFNVDKGDVGFGIAVDSSGNAYVAGYASPQDFPTTPGAFQTGGIYAAFVSKFDPSGALVYSTYLGGAGWETEARAIAVDASGHAYVTGLTTRTDFPTTTGALRTSCAVGNYGGCSDAFVTKLNLTGSGLVYSTYLGGPGADGYFGTEVGEGIAIDGDGNAYVTGWTRSNSFPVTANAPQTTYAGGNGDVFIAKLNAAGSALVYATYLGGTGGALSGDEPYAIAVDGQGQAYVTGVTTSADFPTTPGAYQTTWSGYTGAFISKLSADGSSLVYSTYLRCPGGRIYGGRGIAADAEGNAYVTGGPAEGCFVTTPGAFQPQCSPAGLCADAFVLKMNPSGSAPVWSTFLGGTGNEQGNALALDRKGNVHVAGQTNSLDFPIVDSVQASRAGGTDAFVAKISADGSRLVYSTYLGGTLDDVGNGVGLDAANNTHVTGTTFSTDFPTVNALQPVNHGGQDVVVAKLIAPEKVGLYQGGGWRLDRNGNGVWDGCATDRCVPIGMAGDIPLVGNWNGSATSKVGVFRPHDGAFYLDYNGNGIWDGCAVDRCLSIGMLGDIPLVGDWNGDGIAKVGAFRPSDGVFYLDYNGNGQWDGCAVDRCLQIGMLNDVPLVGDWDGTGSSKVGAFRPSDGVFYLDYNGNGQWDGCGIDRCLAIGLNGDIPLVGDWNWDGKSKIGIFRPSDGVFYLDYNGNGQWNGCGTDRCFQIGMNGDTPLVGDWTSAGPTKVGVYRPSTGTVYLDYNGNGIWDGCETDRCIAMGGGPSDAGVVGKW